MSFLNNLETAGEFAKKGVGIVGDVTLVASGAKLIASNPTLADAGKFLATNAAGVVAGAACEGAIAFATGGVGLLGSAACYGVGAGASYATGKALE
jgi:hypothetical protein